VRKMSASTESDFPIPIYKMKFPESVLFTIIVQVLVPRQLEYRHQSLLVVQFYLQSFS
jgi:hypothetical protein